MIDDDEKSKLNSALVGHCVSDVSRLDKLV